MNEYKTIEIENCDEFVEKKSRFIGHASPVSSIDEAVEFINRIKSKYWDATHNVSAYVLKDNNIQRSSDDGEPSGTAGVPVLDVILKEQLVNVCVVVTRYFGGTLLGSGGLIRAYSHASKIALESANIITMALCKTASVNVEYSFYNNLIILLKDIGANIEESIFKENITVNFSLRENLISSLENKLTELSNGKYSIKIIGEKFDKV